MTVPYAFANLSGNIALAKLDSNFNTPITIGNTSVLLGNTVTTLNNLTLANVTITSGTSNVTSANVTSINVTNVTATLANVTTLNATSAFITTGNIATANVGNLSLLNALTVPSGGTGLVTLPSNNVLLGNGASPIASVSPGTSGNVLTSIGGVWVSNGASGVTALSFGTTGLTPSTSVGGNVTVAGTLVAGNGGTGLSSLTANSVLLGNGSSTIQLVSPGANGNVLTSDGITWSSIAPGGIGSGGLTLLATLTPTTGASSVSVTGLSSYKSIIGITSGITLTASAILQAQISSDNGSTYSTAFQISTTAQTSQSGYFQLFRTDSSSSNKPYFAQGSSSGFSVTTVTTVTGVINAVLVKPNGTTFTGVGNIYIYGLN